MKISDLPLPSYFIEHLRKIGYNMLYPPQELAVKKGLFTKKSMIVTTPTASGKTFIAVLAAFNTLQKYKNAKVIYLVPLKALAREKLREFIEFFRISINNRKVRISIATGDYDTSGEELRYSDIIIATNERMDSILRHGPTWIERIKLVIADEGHLIGVSDRGPILEALLTRLKVEFRDIRIIILSATIQNRNDFKKWLNAEVVSSNWRPVPLEEGVIYDHIVMYHGYREMEFNKITGDPILDNSLLTVSDGGQVVIFTQTRREAVSKAKKYAQFMEDRGKRFFTDKEVLRLNKLADTILEKGEVTELSRSLSSVFRYGVAFHHAGLNPQHREIIENTFREGLIKILTATPTLAAGINLPSRKVIITYTTRRGFGGFQEDISIFEYKQMAGRAGRPQYDEKGEALLYSKYENLADILIDTYISGEPEPLLSHLLENENLESQILGLTATYRNIDSKKISQFLLNTLCSIQESGSNILSKGKEALKLLVNGKLLLYNLDNDIFKPTPLGQRASELYILPSTAIYLRDMINRNTLEKPSDALLLYFISHTKDMGMIPVRSKDRKTIIKEVVDKYHDELGEFILNLEDNDYLFFYDEHELSAWKVALVLKDWIDEKSEDEILRKWRVEPGDLYVLRNNGEWLAYAAKEISKLFSNKRLEREYNKLVLRIRYGVREELLPLVEIEDIGRRRARSLYTYGYRRLSDFKNIRVDTLINIPGIGRGLAEKLIEKAKNL